MPFPTPGDLSDPGIEPLSLVSSALEAILYHLSHQGSSHIVKLKANKKTLNKFVLNIELSYVSFSKAKTQ